MCSWIADRTLKEIQFAVQADLVLRPKDKNMGAISLFMLLQIMGWSWLVEYDSIVHSSSKKQAMEGKPVQEIQLRQTEGEGRRASHRINLIKESQIE